MTHSEPTDSAAASAERTLPLEERSRPVDFWSIVNGTFEVVVGFLIGLAVTVLAILALFLR